GRSSEAARQLASQAPRRVQGASAVPKASVMEQRRGVDAFLDALRRGDFEGLVAVFDPDFVVGVSGMRSVVVHGAGVPNRLAETAGILHIAADGLEETGLERVPQITLAFLAGQAQF